MLSHGPHNLREPVKPSDQEKASADKITVGGLLKVKVSVSDVEISKALVNAGKTP